MVRAKGEEPEVIITGDEGCQGRKGNAMNEHPQQNDDVTVGGRVRMELFPESQTLRLEFEYLHPPEKAFELFVNPGYATGSDSTVAGCSP